MKLICRAPVRVDFAGGFTDVEPYCTERGGAVVNATIGLYSYVSLNIRDGENLRIVSLDYGLSEEAKSIREMEYGGNLDLLKAGLKKMGINWGGEVKAWCDAPPGSGLGASAATAVCLLYAIDRLRSGKMRRERIAELAHLIEKEELGIWGGRQDQYASALGGFLFMEFKEKVEWERVKVSDEFVKDLERRLVLCFSGRSRLSGRIIYEVMGRYAEVLKLLDEMKEIAYAMKEAIIKGDIETVGKLMSENWERQKRLAAGISDPEIDRIFQIAKEEGAIGGKAMGAGGGGCILFLAEDGKVRKLKDKLKQGGIKVLPLKFVSKGVEIFKKGNQVFWQNSIS
ncbi:GHMP kinase [bacterium]|nr:GHMP kinase [bacterium]